MIIDFHCYRMQVKTVGRAVGDHLCIDGNELVIGHDDEASCRRFANSAILLQVCLHLCKACSLHISGNRLSHSRHNLRAIVSHHPSDYSHEFWAERPTFTTPHLIHELFSSLKKVTKCSQ